MFDKFPRYREFDPKVPVWCVTPDVGGCIHRFFDTPPISPSGRYLAVFRFPFEDRQPEPGEAGSVVIVDLKLGTERVVAETCGWEPQMGANINWGGSDNELFFNDVDTNTWDAFAWRLDPLSGRKRRMEGTVYHASPDGRFLISANLRSMCRTQPGYGVRVPEKFIPRHVGAADDDGFFLTDTASGKCRLFVSIRELLSKASPPAAIDNYDNLEIYGFHSKFSPLGNRLMLSVRYFPSNGKPRLNMFLEDFYSVRYAWFTIGIDGSGIACAVGPEHWEKRGHHATWFPDGEHISMNLDLEREGDMRLVRVRYDGSDLRKILPDTVGTGHPTVHPDMRHIITDTYEYEPVAFGDGTVPLRWIDMRDGGETNLVRINVQQYSDDRVMRVDPHPAWDRSWRYVTFNGFVGGTRRVFIADMSGVIQP